MSRLSKLKCNLVALALSVALIAIPNTDFTVKFSAAQADATTDTAQENLEGFSQAVPEALTFDMGTEDSLMRAGKTDGQKTVEIKNRYLDTMDEYQARRDALAEKDAKEAEEKRIREEEEKARAEQEAQAATEVYEYVYEVNESPDSGFLLAIDNPNPNYSGYSVSLTDYDRYVLERLVMGEAGNQGFIGAALVAQSIRDRMVYDGYGSVEAVRTGCGYYGSLDFEPNSDVLSAVSYIFDQGGSAVQHMVRYFYAYEYYTSSWHESMNYVVTYGGHRFFDNW